MTLWYAAIVRIGGGIVGSFLRITVAVLVILVALGALTRGDFGVFLIVTSVLMGFLALTNTFGFRGWMSSLLRIRAGTTSTSQESPPVPQPSSTAVQRDEIKARFRSLPDRYMVAIDRLSDTEVAELSAALRRLQLEPGGALIPRRGETVIGCKRQVQRYEWKRLTIRQGGGGGWSWSVRVMPGLYLRRSFRSPAKSVQVRELNLVDTGILYLTTERLYFDGERNISIWYDKLDSLPQWSKEGFLVLQHGEKDVLVRVGDGQDAMAWAVVAGFLATCRDAG